MTDLYIDDPDEGLAPVTSHPRFVEVAPEEFYDEANEFAPFGSDDGHDTLRSLEGWFEENGANSDPRTFLAELLEDWGFDLPPNIHEAAADELREWSAAEDMNEVLITSEARARVATALGTLKIVGTVSSEMLAEGRAGVRVLRILAEDTTRYPDWPYRGEALRALADIATVLDRIDPATEA
ncbi:hypothetical protein [Microbacterium gorillae]|uniref:hypothetical protein n=1 Tax=Microbacterium gorillae TaxID=1231063 RepID=UPI003D96262E